MFQASNDLPRFTVVGTCSFYHDVIDSIISKPCHSLMLYSKAPSKLPSLSLSLSHSWALCPAACVTAALLGLLLSTLTSHSTGNGSQEASDPRVSPFSSGTSESFLHTVPKITSSSRYSLIPHGTSSFPLASCSPSPGQSALPVSLSNSYVPSSVLRRSLLLSQLGNQMWVLQARENIYM